MKTFPKKRPFFCWTADGRPVYRTWRWCGKVTRTYWFSTEELQEAECQPNDFDIRQLGIIDGSYEAVMAQAKRRIESMKINELV